MIGKFTRLTILLAFCPFLTFAQDVSHEPGIFRFIENGGQWPSDVLFKGDVDGGNIWLEKRGILYEFRDYSVVQDAHGQMHDHETEMMEIPTALVYAHFLGANTEFEKEVSGKSSNYYSYFQGNDESNWASGMYSYNEIEYLDLYNGIDLKFYEKEHELKYEYRVTPEGNYKDIKVMYQGHDKIKLNSKGNVVVSTRIRSNH